MANEIYDKVTELQARVLETKLELDQEHLGCLRQGKPQMRKITASRWLRFAEMALEQAATELGRDKPAPYAGRFYRDEV